MEENASKVHVEPVASLLSDSLLTVNGAGPSLFVINLCTSIAPMPITGKTIPGLESYRLYQVARNEDGRTRHRLRLGFFTSEEAAEQILATVRNSYPTAFTTCLGSDDRKFARGFLTTATATATPAPATPAWQRPAVVTTPAKLQPPAASAAPVTAATAVPPAAAPQAKTTAALGQVLNLDVSWDPLASQARVPAVQAPPPAPEKPAATIELTLAAETLVATPQATTARSAGQPFHVGRGVEIPATSLSLDTQNPQSAANPASPKNAAKAPITRGSAPAGGRQLPTPASLAGMTAPARPTRGSTRDLPRDLPSDLSRDLPRNLPSDLHRPVPELDSTQTIRALTSAELDDDSQEKWFAIQLAVSEQPVNLDAMPQLDIFEAYRLYSVANAGSGKIVHSLRIGFFREQVSAEAVCGYLKTFFASPSVLRISTAEQLRFKDAPAPKAGATAVLKHENTIIELHHARDRAARATIPTVTLAVTPKIAPSNNAATDRSPSGSFRAGATESSRTNASGTYQMHATGSHKVLNPALKPAAKSAGVATRRSASFSKSTNSGPSSGKYKALSKKSLGEQLLDEARAVALSESAIRKLPKSDSLLSRLVGKLTR